MRVITWNMAGGFGFDADNHERAWRYLLELDADVALIQEAVIPSWVQEHWASVVAARKYAPVPGKTDVAWGSAVLTRTGTLEAHVPTDDTWLKELWGSVAVARLDGGMWLASVHSNAYPLASERLKNLPLGEIRRCHDEKLWEIEIIAREIASLVDGERLIAGGDLNSGLLFDATYKYDHNKRLFQNLADDGLVDLRIACGIDQEQQTYFKPGKGAYQLDHVFADADTASRVSTWRVLSEPATIAGLSDHAPIETVFDI